MTDAQMREAARQFIKKWKGKGNEEQDARSYWLDIMQNILGVSSATDHMNFEKRVKVDGHTKRIDVYIPETHVLIEQKSLGIPLDKRAPQSGGIELTPYEQAKRYNDNLAYDENARWIIVSNFGEIWIYDMNTQAPEPTKILLEELQNKYTLLDILVSREVAKLSEEMEVSIKAGDIVGLFYEAFLKQYRDPTNAESLKSLNALCVRLVFCLYAEDAGIFGKRNLFHDYMAAFETRRMREALINLFKVLDTQPNKRDPYLDEELAAFPYVNGGLFSDEEIEIPHFTDEIRNLLLTKASADFDWSVISPTIFGAVFESTLNPKTRRSGGMHYTSIENIHKVIDPLFLDELKTELSEIRKIKVAKTRMNRLDQFQKKLASLVFLDPACGSGNFLTETYLSIRKLENEILREKIDAKKGQTAGQIVFGDLGSENNPIQVSIQQFYGIEINDFAVTVAKTALWIAESQMMKQTEDVIHTNLDFLPLTTNAHIIEGNALRLDWTQLHEEKRTPMVYAEIANLIRPDPVVLGEPTFHFDEVDLVTPNLHVGKPDVEIKPISYDYIMGNPPFVGARLMSKEQKQDVKDMFNGWKNVGNLDYVSCWYKKASEVMRGTSTRCALVSTNSVAQGEAVANLWKSLMENGVHIDFAHRTFRWDSEAHIKAHVHCVIIGFSVAENQQEKKIFNGENVESAANINGYLIDAENIFVESRNKALCDVPEIGIGSQPLDDGNYLFTKEEMDEFVAKEPMAKSYFYPWYGAKEFINRQSRFCLYLGDCEPAKIRKMPMCMKRIKEVQEFRLKSNRASTKRAADTPTRFGMTNIPSTEFILIPKVSSERRRYIPMGFMTPNNLCSDLVFLIPNATLYHFGVLESNVHMSWMRVVAGRLEIDYRYSKGIVYNNFPWCTATDKQRQAIEKTAQEILDARNLYPDSSLADLYDPLTMPPELLKAHNRNNAAVMKAYGFSTDMSETECVAELMKMYQKLVKEYADG